VFVDPSTRIPLRAWDLALDDQEDNEAEPAHVARFGDQVHSKGILGGTQEAGRHIGYLTKYLTKSITETVGLGDDATVRQHAHADRLHAELQRTPCSPRCPVWLLYGIQPRGARSTTTPGVCKAKAHKRNTLGLPGRRVLVSRKWSGKTLTDHRADRRAFVAEALDAVGLRPQTNEAGPRAIWEPTRPGDPDVPSRAHLQLAAVAERRRWRADYDRARLAAQPPTPQEGLAA
jgi:hypothetical protein